MAMFHLHHHQGRLLYFFKLFTVSLPLFCLLSWASSTTPPLPHPPSPSSLAAARSLRTHGYSIFAALIAATNTDSWNGTGTVLAPPDFAFSFAAAKFNNHHPPPRASASLLLHHTLKEPLTWHNLAVRANGHELRTWHPNRCVFVSKGLNGNLGISPRKHSSPTVAVKIRRPDLFVDGHLTVHGVDDVMDPTAASTCSFPDPTAQVESQIDRSFLDHAIRELRRRGFGVVATAMAIKQSHLITQKEITVFAPSDASLFSDSDGFHFDFLHHVVPKRRHSDDIASLSVGTAIETLSPYKSVIIGSENGDVTVNGVAVQSSAVYHNRWIVVLSVSRSIDDAVDSEEVVRISGDESNSGLSGNQASTPLNSGDSFEESLFRGGFPGEFLESSDAGAQSPAQNHSHYDTRKFESQAPASFLEYGQDDEDEISLRTPSPAAEGEATAEWRLSPGVSPATSDDVVSTLSLAVEDEDLICPATLRTLRESGVGTSVYVERSSPSTTHDQFSEKLVQSGPSRGFNKAL